MTRPTRTFLWQLSAVAAAAGLIGVAQAQSDQTAPGTAAAESQTVIEQYEASSMSRNGMDQSSDKVTDSSMDASAERPADTSAAANDAAPADPAAASADPGAARTYTVAPTTIVVVPTVVDQAAVAAKAWTYVEEQPTTREDVVSEAVYANSNGLIARGTLSIAGEDKGTAFVEQADQARITRSTEMYLGKYESKRQQYAAQEQERLNQLALQEQQRQQQLAQQQAQQQEQQLAQPQPQQ